MKKKEEERHFDPGFRSEVLHEVCAVMDEVRGCKSGHLGGGGEAVRRVSVGYQDLFTEFLSGHCV